MIRAREGSIWHLGFLWLCALALLAGCGEGDGQTRVIVEMVGIPPDAQRLEIEARRCEKEEGGALRCAQVADEKAHSITSQLPSRVALVLKKGPADGVEITVRAYGADRCLLDEGSNRALLVLGQDVTVQVLLARQGRSGCLMQLWVEADDEKDGVSAVEVSGAGDPRRCIEGMCEWYVPLDAELAVRPLPVRDAYFAGFQHEQGEWQRRVLRLRAGATDLRIRARFLAPRQCTADGFCWELPWPQGDALYQMYAAAPDRIFVITDGGRVLQYDGRSWRTAAAAQVPGVRLRALWGQGQEIWAGGGTFDQNEKRWAGVILRSADAGATWATLSEPKKWGLIHAIWGNGRGEVWVAGGIPTSRDGVSGEYGFVMRWDGKAWGEPEILVGGALYALWGEGDEVLAGGKAGLVWDRPSDGVLWRRGPGEGRFGKVSVTLPGEVRALWGSGGETWLAGNRGLLWRRVGQEAWRQVAAPDELKRSIYAVGGSGPRDVWLVGERGLTARWDGARLAGEAVQISIAEANLRGVAVPRPGEAWAVGDQGTLLQREAGGWVRRDSRASLPLLNSVWGSAQDDAWAVGDGGQLLHYDGAGWALDADSFKVPEHLYGVFGTGSDDIWAVGGGQGGVILHRDARGIWQQRLSLLQTSFRAIWGTKRLGLWAVGTDLIYHYDYETDVWTECKDDIYALAYGIWGTEQGEVWVVGGGDEWILRHAAGAPPCEFRSVDPVLQLAGGPLHGVWGTGPDDLWISGERGVLIHRTRSGWEDHTLRGAARPALYRLWGRSSTDIWAVGAGGAAYHWDGRSWKLQQSGTYDDLSGMWGTDKGTAWVVGGASWVLGDSGLVGASAATILRWNPPRTGWAAVTVHRGTWIDDVVRAQGGGAP